MREAIGWALLGVVGLALFINLSIAIVRDIRSLNRYIRKKIRERKYKERNEEDKSEDV